MQRWLRPWPGRLRNPDETTSEIVGPLRIQRSFRASRSRSTPRTLSPTGPPGDLPLEAVVSGRPQGPTGQRWPSALAADGSVLADLGTFLAAVVPVSAALPKTRLARPGTPDRARRVAGDPARSVRQQRVHHHRLSGCSYARRHAQLYRAAACPLRDGALTSWTGPRPGPARGAARTLSLALPTTYSRSRSDVCWPGRRRPSATARSSVARSTNSPAPQLSRPVAVADCSPTAPSRTTSRQQRQPWTRRSNALQSRSVARFKTGCPRSHRGLASRLTPGGLDQTFGDGGAVAGPRSDAPAGENR